jgi:hypothetical protein
VCRRCHLVYQDGTNFPVSFLESENPLGISKMTFFQMSCIVCESKKYLLVGGNGTHCTFCTLPKIRQCTCIGDDDKQMIVQIDYV